MLSELLKIFDGLQIPAAFGAFRKPQTPPFAAILGDGEQTFKADGVVYARYPFYTIEYYFAEKEQAKEFAIEDALVRNGFIYQKSADIYIESENVYEIEYTVWRSKNVRSE